MEKQVRVLLADDESSFTEPIALWLQSNGYSVSVATNGRQALERIAASRPDIVFLDIYMPQMDGLEALRRIRQQAPDLPVILITAGDDVEGAYTKMKDLKISGFFPKHHSLQELVRILDTTLRAHAKLKPPANGAS